MFFLIDIDQFVSKIFFFLFQNCSMRNSDNIVTWIITVLLLAIQTLVYTNNHPDDCPDLLTDQSDSDSD